MKVRTSVTQICNLCKFVRRKKRVAVVCKVAKHNQRQG